MFFNLIILKEKSKFINFFNLTKLNAYFIFKDKIFLDKKKKITIILEYISSLNSNVASIFKIIIIFTTRKYFIIYVKLIIIQKYFSFKKSHTI